MKQTNLADIDAFFQKLCEENYADLGNFLLVLTKDREQAQDILLSDCAALPEILPPKTLPGTKSGRVS